MCEDLEWGEMEEKKEKGDKKREGFINEWKLENIFILKLKKFEVLGIYFRFCKRKCWFDWGSAYVFIFFLFFLKRSSSFKKGFIDCLL